MAKHQPWKDLERRHAKRFEGGERLWRPDFGDSIPDGQAPRDVWDTKCYQRFAVVTMFAECKRKYLEFAKGRRFHLCLFSRDKRSAGDLVLVEAEEFARLVRIETAAESAVNWNIAAEAAFDMLDKALKS